MYNVDKKREEKKKISSLKKAEKEAKRAQISVQILVNLINENPPRGVLKNCIYNWFLR